jgi:hypothetical protein
MREHAVRFGEFGALVGVVTDPIVPATSRGRPAVVLLGSGLVHRVGPHRLYVKLARSLAKQGFVVFRFDFSGIGDSGVRRDGMPLERCAVAETRQAMDWLAATRSVDRFVLIALCSGAGFSFQAACADDRVIAISLINAAAHRWGTSAELNRTLVRHYVRMLCAPAFRRNNWRRLLALSFDYGRILGAAGRQIKTLLSRRRGTGPVPAAERIAIAFRELRARSVRALIVYSEGDEGWDYYQLFLRDTMREVVADAQVQVHVVPGANHTFTLLAHQAQLIAMLGRWAEPLRA